MVERHLYRQEIEELLAARWAPRNINMFLARQHTDYAPVPERTLRRYRAKRLAGRMRQAAQYEKLLEDDHVLLDTIRMKAGLVLFQQQRLDRAIEMEEQLGGIVLDQVGKEAERLVRMLDSYEQSLQLHGVLPRDSRTLASGGVHVAQQNVTVLVTKQIVEEVDRLVERIPEEVRAPLGSALQVQRLAESDERIKKIETEVQSRASAAVDVDGSVDE